MLKYYYFLIKFLESVLNLIIVISLNIVFVGRKSSLPTVNKSVVQVLGNGPSLINDVDKILECRKSSSLMVVNSFANSLFFEKFRPEYYVIFDPAFFSVTTLDRIVNLQNSILNSLINKTSWEMALFLPYSAKHSFFLKEIEQRNILIKIHFVRNIPMIGGFGEMNRAFFKYGIANPLFQNVMVVCIFLGIKLRFSKIFLWGADHSWLPNLSVTSSNQVVLNDKHISFNDSNYIVVTNAQGTVLSLDEFLFSLSSMFREYRVLNKLAISTNVEILNYTKNSFIDAFNRKD